ncbi:hypothetical protein [Sphingomonas sp. OTU376]|uniref:hypothetical protein n=1 Tax=Sphingomonas sp. OTU376 TaxID=3043863 RepID=UPI00313C98E9
MPDFMVGCAFVRKPEQLAGTVRLDHHGGSLIIKGADKAIAFVWNDAFRREPLYGRFIAEKERAFLRDCVTAVSVEAVGRLVDTPGDMLGDRKFFVEHLLAVGPPERDVIARVPKNLPPERCPHANGS